MCVAVKKITLKKAKTLATKKAKKAVKKLKRKEKKKMKKALKTQKKAMAPKKKQQSSEVPAKVCDNLRELGAKLDASESSWWALARSCLPTAALAGCDGRAGRPGGWRECAARTKVRT